MTRKCGTVHPPILPLSTPNSSYLQHTSKTFPQLLSQRKAQDPSLQTSYSPLQKRNHQLTFVRAIPSQSKKSNSLGNCRNHTFSQKVEGKKTELFTEREGERDGGMVVVEEQETKVPSTSKSPPLSSWKGGGFIFFDD